jgi:predicted component of type VI protein secretion system
MTAFIAREGALAGQRFELAGERTIGREGADITIDDDQVSRTHARVTVAGETVTIEDLGSTNGTFVNGERIDAATTVAPGDEVRIGTTMFALEAEAAAAPEPEPEPEPEPAPAMPEPAMTVARSAPATPEPPAAPEPPAPPAPEPAPVPAAPAPPALTGTVGAPREPFGAYLAPETARHGGGIQSRQRGPILVTYAIVLGVAIALAVYFAYV